MAKARKKPIVHVLKLDDLPEDNPAVLIGIKSNVPLYKIVFDLNKQFNTHFRLSEKDLQVERKKRIVSFENYVTPEDRLGLKIRLVKNEILQQLPHPVSLFETHEAFYLFPELEMMDYILMIPIPSNLNHQILKEKFIVPYSIQWIEIDLQQCHTAFPVFPG